jgi:hypothetical protein
MVKRSLLKLPPLLLLLLILSSCATTSTTTTKQTDAGITAGKTLLTIQQSIVNTREAISVPCQKGSIPQADCKKLDGYYQQSKPTYDAAVDAAILSMTTGDVTKYEANKAALQSLLTNMLAITVKYGVGGAK